MISKAMGHSSIAVTERYLRVSNDEDIRPMVMSYGSKIKKNSKNKSNKVATLESYRKLKLTTGYK